MTEPTASRLPYAEPASPHELYPDCQAAGRNLQVEVSATHTVARPAPRAVTSMAYSVPDRAATMAGRLHLHLN